MLRMRQTKVEIEAEVAPDPVRTMVACEPLPNAGLVTRNLHISKRVRACARACARRFLYVGLACVQCYCLCLYYLSQA